uniref:Putative methyltransferase type 11 n=1 Tax=Magnetococcus massalia (strain MO-1) TaxID=451514 RepID=A0A1S7LIB9_MAGMO|nr:Putative methyltransferase type 11 [Candidatus Magnetococcus massalia]
MGGVVEQWLKGRPVATTLALGYPQPYLTILEESSDELIIGTPAEMGVIKRSPLAKPRAQLVLRPDALPLPDASQERIVMMHLLEGVGAMEPVLREMWRVLKPGGRLFVIVPNRGGLWSRRDNSPFGWGRPFSPQQLSLLLEESLFSPQQSAYALFMPPFSNPRLCRRVQRWEKAGQRWFAPLGGVVLCEAEKQVYAANPIRSRIPAMGRGLAMPAVERSADELHRHHT